MYSVQCVSTEYVHTIQRCRTQGTNFLSSIGPQSAFYPTAHTTHGPTHDYILSPAGSCTVERNPSALSFHFSYIPPEPDPPRRLAPVLLSWTELHLCPFFRHTTPPSPPPTSPLAFAPYDKILRPSGLSHSPVCTLAINSQLSFHPQREILFQKNIKN